jgi:hypothetical protein
MVFTTAARHAIAGPGPLFVFDANTRGVGKSLAADAVGTIASGLELPRTTWASDPAETRKMITSVLLAGEPIVLLDNIASTLGNPPLDAVLTCMAWTDRVLGSSEMTARLPATTIWSASGNNLLLAADTARRSLRMRLESPLERPEERAGFRHPKLLQWLKSERGRIASAAVTILRGWHVAGRPDMGLAPWGSFEAWSDIVRNAIVWAGLADPGASRQQVQHESDREAMLLRLIIQAWSEADPQGHGMTVAEALKRSTQGEEGLAAVFAELGDKTGKPNARSVGMKLHHLRGRICGGMYLARRDTNRGASWFAASAASDTKATSDTTFSPPMTRARTHAPAHARDRG